jgi:oligosaccharyl transferase (archaeosortase A-associated)
MTFFSSENNLRYLIGGCLILFMGIAFVLRIIPALYIPPDGFLLNSGADVWYTMRQIDVMVSNFPQYNWFDPMTAFPEGKTIDWGPLYPFLAAAAALMTGATSRTEIINTAGWIAPVMAALLVPVTYLLGKMIWDRMAGLIGAGLVSVISYQYFIQSSYGWTDHHSAEVFFIALFFLAYLSALSAARKISRDRLFTKDIMVPVLLSGLAGTIYFLAYLTAPTVLLCLIVIALATFFQIFLDHYRNTRSEYLLLANCVAFGVIALLETLFGFLPWAGYSLITYSISHVYVMLGLIAWTVLLYGLSRLFFTDRLKYYLSLCGIVVGGIFLVGFIPALQAIRDQASSLLFGSSAYTLAIRETQAWSLAAAYDSFNLSLILMAGGIVILALSVFRKQKGEQVFLLGWLIVMLALTIPHQRFQLYLTVPIALTAAICSSAIIRWSWDGAGTGIVSWFLHNYDKEPSRAASKDGSSSERLKMKKAQRESTKTARSTLVKRTALAVILVITILVFALSAAHDFTYVANTPTNGIPSDWAETLIWMSSSTPPTGIDYYGTFDQKTFTYPDSAYGILAPWEQGHRITFFANRLPIMNPFQNNLGGNDGGAAFYLSADETRANAILSNFRGRYVITDLRTATDTFPSLIPWVSGSDTITPYIYWAFVQDSSGGLTKTHLLGDAYFQTMIVRLQVFDGSLVSPDTSQYTTYIIRSVPDSGNTAGVGGLARVITGMQKASVTDSKVIIAPEGSVLNDGDTHADFFSTAPYEPVRKVSALEHYRLVHESPTNISVQLAASGQGGALPDIRLVKVFEYVKGAHITGEGMIELNLITNTGRTFVYRQESSNGEFVVPYSTEGGTTEVKATGPYRIAGTSRTVSVTEADVLNGTSVR